MLYQLFNASTNVSYNLRIDELIALIVASKNDVFYKLIDGTQTLVCNEIVLNTQFICHRVNTHRELQTVPSVFGVEIDVRDNNGVLSLSHDPFLNGEHFEEYILSYRHNTLILNIKSERTELKCVEIMKKHHITNYFFLDSSFPMIYLLHSKYSNRNTACRISEYEPVEYYHKIQHMVSWVWIDCFSLQPLTSLLYSQFRANNTNMCVVSPELQNHPASVIREYRDMFIRNNTIPDAICCKAHNIIYWI